MANLGREEFFPQFPSLLARGCPSPLLGLIEDWKGALSIPAGLLTAVALLAAAGWVAWELLEFAPAGAQAVLIGRRGSLITAPP
jgi:hypothetical protein